MSTYDPDRDLDRLQDIVQLRQSPGALTAREATIISMRLGLYDGNVHTQQEIGRALGLSGSRVGQIEKRAWAKLRGDAIPKPSSATPAEVEQFSSDDDFIESEWP